MNPNYYQQQAPMNSNYHQQHAPMNPNYYQQYPNHKIPQTQGYNANNEVSN